MEEQKSGFMIVNKPVGITSFGVIAKLRKITGIKKIGHAGTLDPFATGVLIVAIGRKATREIDTFVKLNKEYIAKINLSSTTDTYDTEGEITEKFEDKGIDQEELEKVLKSFLGKQKQIPPMFSAKKIGGKKLYELAREGKVVERQPSDIEIFNIEKLAYKWPYLDIKLKVSSGTYIRTLGYDIGKKLGYGGHLKELQRTEIDKYSLKDSNNLEDINQDNWYKLLFMEK